ncbi:GAF domain-containing protein [Pseudonocardia sp. KRD291]|uniref:GAF domain-containing protein n=1 Tax=Pseudonocardia sp. KRD291 TaxID=2792007 RepID=UPI001C4A117A|nr:GAF domain-containing protein [Pseudonocardia sp. KRD291]MBW0101300.1 GAF domain-containing protein [Pseudonocardia sp. KRD291]
MSQALATAVAVGGSAAALAVCRAVVSWVPMTGAAITLMSGPDGQEPVCATDAGAARIDELQFDLGDGPCVESFTTGRAVLVSDITDGADARWPVFAAAAAATGARGMFVFPLSVGAARLGVLDCYRDTPGSLDDDELAAALAAVDAAVWTLLEHGAASTLDGDRAGSDWFNGSPLARAEVHQATGMLSVQAGLRPGAALARLRAGAFATGRPIAEMAADVVSRRLRLDSDGAWHSTTAPPMTSTYDTGRPGDEEPGDEEKRS